MNRMKLLTIKESITLDQKTIEQKLVSGNELMRRAGSKIATHLKKLIASKKISRDILLIAGKGNNGGDVFATSYYLKKEGLNPSIILITLKKNLKGSSLFHFKKLPDNISLKTATSPLQFEKLINKFKGDIIVDGILGSGFKPPLKDFYSEVIQCINKQQKLTVSIDIPSGLNTSHTTSKKAGITADITLTIGSLKKEMISVPSINYCGRIYPLDIGFPEKIIDTFNPEADVFTQSDLKNSLNKRKRNSHKGTFGHALLIGGQFGFTGALILAAKGAMHTGVGLSTLCSPSDRSRDIFHTSINEIMTIDFETIIKSKNLQNYLNKFQAICIGPGLGQDTKSKLLLTKILKLKNLKLILDADALNMIAKKPVLLKNNSHTIIMTPHPGEAARLLNTSPQIIEADRLEAARQLTSKFECTIVLKGANTIVSLKNSQTIHLSGTAAGSQAGMGDVLAGVITALLAMGYEPVKASNIGVALTSFSAEKLENKIGPFGFLASRVAQEIPKMCLNEKHLFTASL